MLRRTLLGLTLLLIGPATYALAADAAHTTAPTTGHAAHASAAAAHLPRQQPTVPAPSVMPGLTVIIVLFMFGVAAVIGPVVRYHAPEEPPETSSHDDHAQGAHGAHDDAHHGHAH